VLPYKISELVLGLLDKVDEGEGAAAEGAGSGSPLRADPSELAAVSQEGAGWGFQFREVRKG
jgi:hypothetical protein